MNTAYKSDIKTASGRLAEKLPRGLTSAEAEASRDRHGANTIAGARRKSLLRRYLEGFSDPIIRILIGALIVNIIFSIGHVDWYETAGIIVAVMISTVVSAVSEYGSDRAFDRMRTAGDSTPVRVVRDGEVGSIPLSGIVVDDVVMLGTGDMVPADGFIVSGTVTVDQSALNGESRDEKKYPLTSSASHELSPDVKCALLRGSTVTSGNGTMRVSRVGKDTMYGEVAASLTGDRRESPLKERLSALAKSVSSLGYCAAILVAVAYLFRAFFIETGMDVNAALAAMRDTRYLFAELLGALTLAISVIVVAVPEGLPMMITVVLSSNMKRMLRDNVLVKKLVGIETAGSLNILFCDKTGTLTRGDFTVTRIITADGEFSSAVRMREQSGRMYGLYLDSAVHNTESGIGRENGRRAALGGNATDRAILSAVIDDAGSGMRFRAIARRPFDSASKYSLCAAETPEGTVTYIKGAPDIILPLCDTCRRERSESAEPFYSKEAITERCRALAAEGARVIAHAVIGGSHNAICGGLSFLALTVINDEARAEARGAVTELRGAGIQVVMITGDGKDTARAIAGRVGIVTSPRDLILSGRELAAMGDAELREALPRLRVVCRALPSDKERLVRISGELGLVTGMTGDGVNDAPALRAADVGFAMGAGTEVAKEAGDIVILDNNIKSIGRAVLYGRTIFDSIRKFIVFQLTMNLCAVGVSIIGPFIGIEAPVTVIQMLWVNLIMDTLGGLAFAGEAPRADYMREMPKKRDEKILSGRELARVLVTGTFQIALCISFLSVPYLREAFGFYDDYDRFITVFFAMFVFCGIFCAFNCRTPRINLASHLSLNPAFIFIMTATCATQLLIVYFGGSVFRTVPLAVRDLAAALTLAFTVVPFDMMRKFAVRK